MEKIKLGFLGLGQRGTGLLVNILNNFKDVDIVAVCDGYEDRAVDAAKKIEEKKGYKPTVYTDHKLLLKDDNVNTVIISASWEAHASLAIEAMKAGKITGLEVGGAYSVDDCWSMVKCYEETKTPFMFLENCCYGKEELIATNMVRQGVLGEVVYCHGSYCHDLRDEISGGVKNRHYRLRNYLIRNCDNYPTHELGPIAKILNINRGNRMLSLCSMASKARGLSEYVQDKEGLEFLRDKHFAQGDVVTTMIKCANGELITLKLDTTLPRAYSREFEVSGTKGMFSEPLNMVLNGSTPYDHNNNIRDYSNNMKEFEEKYSPKIWKEITKEQIDAGHGGMDTHMLKAFFDSILENKEMPIDIYDAVTWMVVTCLSEDSISKGGMPVEIPDFTSGKWIMRESKDVVEF